MNPTRAEIQTQIDTYLGQGKTPSEIPALLNQWLIDNEVEQAKIDRILGDLNSYEGMNP